MSNSSTDGDGRTVRHRGLPSALSIVTQGETFVNDQNSIVRYEIFRGRLASWDTVFAQAAEYANRVGPERIISISHSHDGIVAVWYRASEAVPRS